jgi:hypothetical protein
MLKLRDILVETKPKKVKELKDHEGKMAKSQDGDLWYILPELNEFLEIVEEKLDFEDYLYICDNS